MKTTPFAELSAKVFGSFLALGAVGAAMGRTSALAPALWGRSTPGNRTVGLAALGGFAVAMAVLVVLAAMGVEQLPDWAKVPPLIASSQALHALVMATCFPDDYEPSVDLSAGDLAFVLYGVMMFPPTALFILAMAIGTFLL